MNSTNLVSINLHGILGENVGKTWRLAVSSVGEALNAIEVLSKHKLYNFLHNLDKKGQKYQVLINKSPFVSSKPITENNVNDVKETELMMKLGKKLKSIDIIPVLEGADKGILGIILGVVLIAVGIFTLQPQIAFPGAQMIGAGLIIGGIGMIAAGVINLLSSPPTFGDLPEFDSAAGKQSYLFGGPINTTREGGPVPVGYGRLRVGSQVISVTSMYSDITPSTEGRSEGSEIQEVGGCMIYPTSISDVVFTKNVAMTPIIFRLTEACDHILINGWQIYKDDEYQLNPGLDIGELPPGVTLAMSTEDYHTHEAILSGTPTESGTFKFTISAYQHSHWIPATQTFSRTSQGNRAYTMIVKDE